MPNAEALYNFTMRQLKEAGEAYGKAQSVLEFVSEHDETDVETLSNYLRRGKKYKTAARHRIAVEPVERFQSWLHRKERRK